ncbi:putative methyltransferase PMT18 [Acorus calamus]|uniref:Methyltransferase n=1 Tax=Acorus calamus TaxID=4465 RepID=A0AAV9D0N4_ACOCL|nr:putative methyltransferase PMT18 [Acorus calamus]
MESCITPLPNVNAIEDIAGGAIDKWPKRLNASPPRISSGTVQGITSQDFNKDNQLWHKRISYYDILLNSLPTGKYRNIMDMNAGLGGFAAALSKYPVWVMNSVPWDSTNSSLGAIYERGLLGTYMDWCEAFSTYPRTYDLIHANGLFSMYVDKCDVLDILLEMDRILCPEGAVIIRDHIDVIVKVKKAADRLNWQSRIVQNEHGPFDPEKLLIVDNSVVLSSH